MGPHRGRHHRLTDVEATDRSRDRRVAGLRAALMRNPVDVETRVLLAAALVAQGHRAPAKWEADEVRLLAPGFIAREWLATYPMTDAAQRQRLLDLLAAIDL